MIELTEAQQHALGQPDPARLLDPRTNETYVLVRADIYDRMRPSSTRPPGARAGMNPAWMPTSSIGVISEQTMFYHIDRHALFHEVHCAIEESATKAARQLMEGDPELYYPPNHGFSADELAALRAIPRTPSIESALRKMLAATAAYPVFHLFCLVDGVTDPAEIDIQDDDRADVDDDFYASYWAWRRRRPNPGWQLDM
jgi:hypothetical protein